MTIISPTIDVGAPPGTVRLPVGKLSTEQYLRLIDAGAWAEGQRVELFGGYLVPMAPSGPQHSYSILNLADLFAPALPHFRLAIQITLAVSEGNVFDPDLMLLHKHDRLKTELPCAADVALLLESSSSSLDRDQKAKLPAYAAAGIGEYWILDLNRQQLLVHRDPHGEAYRDVRTLAGDDEIAPLALPSLTIRIAAFFE